MSEWYRDYRAHWRLAVVLLATIATDANAVITSFELGGRVATPGQPAYGVMLDGVASIQLYEIDLDTPNATCTAALISERHLLSAAHCFDRDKDARADPFFLQRPHTAAFELADRVETLAIDGNRTAIPAVFSEIPADIAVLTLTEPAPSDIPRYELSSYAQAFGEVVVVGYGLTGSGALGIVSGIDSSPTKRVGINRYEALRDGPPFAGLELLVYDFDSGAQVHNAVEAVLGLPSDLGLGVDEVYATRGDSGAPVFMSGIIVAVSAYGGRIDGEPEGSWGELSFDVPVGTFRTFIESATNGEAVFVPEPSLEVWLFPLVAHASRTRRRRQQT